MGSFYRGPGLGTLKTEESARAAHAVASSASMRLILASDGALKFFVLFLFLEPAVALCVFCLCFLLGPHWERASELFPL